MLNSVYCKRMTSNFLGFKVLATAQWNLNDLKNAQVSFMDLPCRKAGILKCHQKKANFSNYMHFAHTVGDTYECS